MVFAKASNLAIFHQTNPDGVGDPDAPLKVHGEVGSSSVDDSIGFGKGFYRGVSNADNGPTFHAHPDLPLMIQGHGVDLFAGEVGNLPKGEGGEADSIEADESAIGADPEVALGRLCDGGDAIVGEAVLGLPDAVKPIVRDCSVSDQGLNQEQKCKMESRAHLGLQTIEITK